MGETTAIPKINSLDDLRPGDLLFTNIGGLVPGVFPVGVGQLMLGERVRIGRLTVDHVGVVVDQRDQLGAPRLVQAMPRGAEEIEMTEERHWNERCAYVRLPEDYLGQAQQAANVARLMALIDTPYSFASYAALALWRYGVKTPRLEAWIDRRTPEIGASWPTEWITPGVMQYGLPCEAICSVLADQAWSLAGKRVVSGVSPQAVTPGKLALNVMPWRRPGVVWGGLGFFG